MIRIPGIHSLAKYALMGKAVICPKSMALSNPKPAAFVIQMKALNVLHFIELGLYLYEKKPSYRKIGEAKVNIYQLKD